MEGNEGLGRREEVPFLDVLSRLLSTSFGMTARTSELETQGTAVVTIKKKVIGYLEDSGKLTE